MDFTSGGKALQQISSVSPALLTLVAAAAFVAFGVMIVRHMLKTNDEITDVSEPWSRGWRIVLFVIGIAVIGGSGAAMARELYKGATKQAVSSGDGKLPEAKGIKWERVQERKTMKTPTKEDEKNALADTDPSGKESQERELKAKRDAADKARDARNRANEKNNEVQRQERENGYSTDKARKEAADANDEAAKKGIDNVLKNGNTPVDNWDANGVKGYKAVTGRDPNDDFGTGK